jgi:hypothetical protein
MLVLLGFGLLGLFSSAAADPDTWWHLAAGKYIWQNHKLPVPDPFSYTSDLGQPSYPGELQTRRFNLTHEWGMELVLYLAYAFGGFPGMILLRACLLTVFCGLTGWLAWRRSSSFYRGLAASLLAAALATSFRADRAYLATFVMAALTILVYEARRGLWLLPVVFLLWANCHGGFVVGWAIAAAYSAEAAFLRLSGRPLAGERQIWSLSALSILVTLINPNGFGVLEVMRHYRDSPMQTHIYEWQYPAWWPPDRYNALVIVTGLILLWARRRVRVVDWLLFGALGTASATALRNTIFIGLIGPVLLAAYLPKWRRPIWPVAEYAVAVLLVFGLGREITGGSAFQLRMADWDYPVEAADFLIRHGISAPMFNTYEDGGYLMWRLWPQERVFIDGRALNESVWQDYEHIALNGDYPGGKTTQDLLKQYGVEVVVMSGLDPLGNVLLLAAALADPNQTEWKLVFRDAKGVIFMRQPPNGVQPLNPLESLASMEMQCDQYIQHATAPKCAREIGWMYLRLGDRNDSRRWLGRYLSIDHSDPVAVKLYQQAVAPSP